VWLMDKIIHFEIDRGHSLAMGKKIEREILEHYSEIYGGAENVQIEHLIKARRARKNCPLVYKFKGSAPLDEYQRVVCEPIQDRMIEVLYDAYMFDPEVRHNAKQIIKLEGPHRQPEMMDLIEILQDYLITEYAAKGIIIEANPSSNLFVSPLRRYKNHPVFRFWPPKKKFLKKGKKFNRFGKRHGCIGVCINSDDPSLFVTTLQNEFRLLKSCAIEDYHCSDKDAQDWIDEIREYGVQIFRENDHG